MSFSILALPYIFIPAHQLFLVHHHHHYHHRYTLPMSPLPMPSVAFLDIPCWIASQHGSWEGAWGLEEDEAMLLVMVVAVNVVVSCWVKIS